MDNGLVNTFVELLERQQAGEIGVVDELRQLAITHEQGYCLSNLYQEWRDAFSYSPGRVEALTPLIGLARKLLTFVRDDPLELFEQPQWEALIGLRGPVEAIEICTCLGCGRQYTSVGTSGLSQADPLVCLECGNVYLKSEDDESQTPPCPCGHVYAAADDYGCPGCGSLQGDVVEEVSPYEYFEKHSYSVGPGL